MGVGDKDVVRQKPALPQQAHGPWGNQTYRHPIPTQMEREAGSMCEPQRTPGPKRTPIWPTLPHPLFQNPFPALGLLYKPEGQPSTMQTSLQAPPGHSAEE